MEPPCTPRSRDFQTLVEAQYRASRKHFHQGVLEAKTPGVQGLRKGLDGLSEASIWPRTRTVGRLLDGVDVPSSGK